MRTIQLSELDAHKDDKSCWVFMTSTDRVYDVTDFLEDHPGGGELITKYGGRDVTDIMKDSVSHEHSESAYEVLEDCAIGVLTSGEAVMSEKFPSKVMTLEESDEKRRIYELTGLSCADDLSKDTDYTEDHKTHKFIDLNKPMLMQILTSGFSKEFYLEQVHRPRHYKGGASAPLFGNFLEPLSKTAWYIVPIVWLPCIAAGATVSAQHIGAFNWAICFAAGLFIWTFVEYALHRFLFHVDNYLPDHPIALTLHFLLHGVHHYLPMDRLRLVMPPTLFVALASPFWQLAKALFPYYTAMGVFSGGILGYVIYDLTHYFLHHRNLPSFYKELKSYHLAHHYQDYELGYGVSSKFWDHVFGTTLIMQKTQ